MIKKILYFFLIIPLIAGTTGKIRGKVIDSSTNEPLIGCNIYLYSTIYGTSADQDGNYMILNIPPGNYEIHASMIGYDNYIVKNIEVNVDLTSKIDFSLNESSLEIESVIINAAPKLINKNLTSTTAIITNKTISKLPVNEVSEILNLQAGFVDGHLRGGRSSEIVYMVDGMPMTDGYDGSAIIDINKDSIREMQLISGSFNAEYGQAMSGVVNITTNEGTNKFQGSIDSYFGDYLSNHSNLFYNIDNFDLSTTHNFNFSLNGSIVKDKLFYYLSGRYIYYQGVYEGLRKYYPYSYGYELENQETNESYWHILGTDEINDNYVNQIICNGPVNCNEDLDEYYNYLINSHMSPNSMGDNKFIPMDWNIKKYGQLSLIWKPTQTSKIKFSHFNDDIDFQEYDRYYKLNPDGNLSKYRLGETNLLQFNKTINKNSFYTLGFVRNNKIYNHNSFDDLSAYVHEDLNNQNTPSYSFSVGGVNQNIFERISKTNTIKFDYTNQLNNFHQIKLGLSYKEHEINYKNINLKYFVENGFNPIYNTPFVTPIIEDISSINTSIYDFKPEEFSFYFQDKIELDEMIINVGLRYDYFDANGNILSDPTDPFIYDPVKPQHICFDDDLNGICGEDELAQSIEDRLEYWYNSTKIKSMLSPRLGASFPISDQGVFHFSYGHFFQIPKFELLYHNSDIDLDRGGTGNIGVIGNADLKPEKTISYEIGVQYKLDNKSAVDMTMYFRDIRDLTGTRTEVIYTHNGATYHKYENSDFAFIKGLVLSYKKNYRNGFSTTIDYTFQQAKGTASDPFDAHNAQLANQYPEIHIVPLNWDQRHTINTTLFYDSKNWGLGAIGKIGSGQPYTPQINSSFSTLAQNSKTKPISWNIDLRAYWQIPIIENSKFYINIFNIFDQLNHVSVYNDTGYADRTLYLQEALEQNTSQIINSIDEWFDNETFYSSPRRLEIGFRIEFN